MVNLRLWDWSFLMNQWLNSLILQVHCTHCLGPGFLHKKIILHIYVHTCSASFWCSLTIQLQKVEACLRIDKGHCAVFMGKTLSSHSASLHPGVYMGTSKCWENNPVMDQRPIQLEVEILLVTSCYRNRR